ncbi:MAG: cupin domain-containing protein [Gammaproteobacteria bacterium]|nr:cupin domain-containing protein [Gammaproteobacteria bacterium]
MKIEHWNTVRDGPLSEPGFRAKLEARGYACAIYTYPPGTYFAPHAHAQDKIDGVLRGRFRICMDGMACVLEAGDCIAVPRGRLHSAEVVGEEPVVSIDAVRP